MTGGAGVVGTGGWEEEVIGWRGTKFSGFGRGGMVSVVVVEGVRIYAFVTRRPMRAFEDSRN